MLALRSAAALRPAVRAAPRLALAAPTVARRGVVTAAERWNEDDWHQAHSLVKTGSVDLSRNIPDIEGKWESLGKPQQIATWVLLEDVMKKDWNEMTDNEKRAAWFIAYGPYGPRKPDPPHTRIKIFIGTLTAVAAGIILTTSVQRLGGAKDRPITWNTEWQQAMNARARAEKNDPITGVGAEDYKGKGFVTSYPI